MTIEQWLEDAKSDAYRRKLPELADMLDGLARATSALRAADWNEDAAGSAAPAMGVAAVAGSAGRVTHAAPGFSGESAAPEPSASSFQSAARNAAVARERPSSISASSGSLRR